MSRPPPPAPVHLLRGHTAAITALSISDDNERVYSGDASGNVIISSTRTLRAISSWNPHTDSILGVEEFGSNIVTDHKLHVWTRIEDLPSEQRVGGSATMSAVSTPTLSYSMDVNALNYCRLSLLALPDISEETATSSGSQRELIALPNLVDSSTADIWLLPQCDRLHAAIGKDSDKPIFTNGKPSTGIIMSLHLYSNSETASVNSPTSLRLLCAYENGSVALRKYTRDYQLKSVEGKGWDIIWTHKAHVETIMAMTVSKTNTFALTVSVDHLIGRYELTEDKSPVHSTHRTKHAGNACIALRDDGKVCAVGGWDGSIRLFSTKSFKSLGALKYHKASCQALTFAHYDPANDTDKGASIDKEEDEDDLDEIDEAERSLWLLAGGKDNRLSIWSLITFDS
ncbi:WD-40 repeat-containing protein [Coprinopsis marcescibilis]|uniref:ASTRA-associated protein 1 n=1 Tax=Coprinopsis marcescibilis TaxID=230819 RepID=A0A5C3L341_COPMA|nr:WD-40 repeat-containing protein [Coprinopsis marcescibilis]